MQRIEPGVHPGGTAVHAPGWIAPGTPPPLFNPGWHVLPAGQAVAFARGSSV
jgi:hypothetical protein